MPHGRNLNYRFIYIYIYIAINYTLFELSKSTSTKLTELQLRWLLHAIESGFQEQLLISATWYKPHPSNSKCQLTEKYLDNGDSQKMSTRRQLVKPDVDTDKAPVGEDVRRRPDTAGSGIPSPDSIHRSSISFKPKELTLSSVVTGRAMQADDQLVRTTPKDGDRRAGRQHLNPSI